MPQNRRFIALFFTLEPNEQSPMGDSLHNFTPPIFEKSAMFLPGGLQVWHMTDKQQSWVYHGYSLRYSSVTVAVTTRIPILNIP